VTAPEHPAVTGGVDALTQLNGKAPEVGRWVFSTNGVATCGMFGIPTIGFGPADERFAHSPQDQIPVKHLEAAAAFYAAFPQAYGKATAK
jgi:acetylornithine deacetylase/succinyl-diaminopimelate desuccinylase-like protein